MSRAASAAKLGTERPHPIPHTRRALASHAVRAKAAARQTVTLRFRFPRAALKKIKPVLAKRTLRAKVLVNARNAEGEVVTLSKSVRVKR